MQSVLHGAGVKHPDTLRRIEDESGFCFDAEGNPWIWLRFFPHFYLPDWVIEGAAISAEQDGLAGSTHIGHAVYVARRVEVHGDASTAFGPIEIHGISETFRARFKVA